MRDLMSKPKATMLSPGDGSSTNNVGCASGQVDNEKTKILSLMNDDICSAILDITFQRMLKREKIGASFSLGALELWSDDFEGKGDFSQYRFKLVNFTEIFVQPLVEVV